MDDFTIKQLKDISLSMFRKNFFGIFHGSISSKVDTSKMVINKKDAIFDEIEAESLIELYFNKDYRWKEASRDVEIHKSIYESIHEAKYIAYASPPYTVAYSLKHNFLSPVDFFGSQEIGYVEVYDPKNFEDWYDRAHTEISRYFRQKKTNIMIIKGYGVYVYGRDIAELAKKIAMVEQSCMLFNISENL